AGLVVFVLGKKALNGAGEPPVPLARPTEFTLYGTGLVAVAVMWALVQYVGVVQTLLMVSGVLLLAYVAAVAALQIPYGSFAASPSDSKGLIAGGMVLMLLQPLSDALGLPTSAATDWGLSIATLIFFVGL